MIRFEAMPLSSADQDYVVRNYLELDTACRRSHLIDADEAMALIADRALPAPSYVLPDGRGMVPHDYFDLLEQYVSPAAARNGFAMRLEAASRRRGLQPDVGEEWEAYLDGLYGVCLNRVTPERIAEKAILLREIERLLDRPDPSRAPWRDALRCHVDALDAIERPFAHHDESRFGRPSSRVRFIERAHDAYPDVFGARLGRDASVLRSAKSVQVDLDAADTDSCAFLSPPSSPCSSSPAAT